MHMYESVHNVRASSKSCTLMTLILYIYSGTEGGRERGRVAIPGLAYIKCYHKSSKSGTSR